MCRHSILVSLACLLAGCAATEPSGSSDLGRYAAGQWQSFAPEQIAAGMPADAVFQPLGGRLRRTAADEILLEIYLVNASTAPGTNQISVAMDMSSFWKRGAAKTPSSGTYEIDPAKRLELLGTHFPGEVQAGAAELHDTSSGAIGLVPVHYPDNTACVFAWQAVDTGDERWRPAPSRIFKTMRVCAPTLEVEPLLRSFANLDIYRIVTAPGRTATSDADPRSIR